MVKFAGDKKEGLGLFGALETAFVKKYVSKIPKGIETYHLTLMTIIWSIFILIFSFLAQFDIDWLWLVSAMIFAQYITDLFDGAVGRHRHTGLIKWGYYMDHFLDYFFLCSILIGYSFILPDNFKYLFFFILALFIGFMMNSYLSFTMTNKFKIAYLKIGPTEIRLVFIIINTLLIIFGKTYLKFSLPYVLIGALLCLIYVVYDTQKKIYKIDMDEKKKSL